MKVGGWFSVGPDAIKVCTRCGCAGLAWAKAKSGRSYLVHTRRVRSDNREAYWVMPNAPHSCEEYRARVAARKVEESKPKPTLPDHEAREFLDKFNALTDETERTRFAAETYAEWQAKGYAL